MPNFISKDAIEQGMVQRFQHLYGYDVLDCHTSIRRMCRMVRGVTRGVLFHAFGAKCMKQDPNTPLGHKKRAASRNAATRQKANGLVCYYKEPLSITTGLVQPPVKIVARCARTI